MNRILAVLDLVIYFLYIQSSYALLTYCIQSSAGCRGPFSLRSVIHFLLLVMFARYLALILWIGCRSS
jgi:hypothetical protein